MNPESTAETLILSRSLALQRADFAAVYRSYHQAAPFRQFFPDESAYLDYARQEIAPLFCLLDCTILRSRQSGDEADVLFLQTFVHDGKETASLEIGRCRRQADVWTYWAGLRIDQAALADPVDAAGWDDLIAAGNGLWI